MTGSDSDVERARFRRLERFPQWRGPASKGSAARLGQVTTASPTKGKFLRMHPVTIGGTEVEGGTASLDVDTSSSFSALLLGPANALTGDQLVAHSVASRWVVERGTTGGGGGGGGGVIVAGCLCSPTPITITMSVTNAGLNNGIFNNDTIVYGPTPSLYFPSIIGTASSWLGSTTFVDASTGLNYRYYLFCSGGVAYKLTRVFPVIFGGGPGRDSDRYSWVPGFGGNTCTPYSLTNGTIFVGGDSRTVVSLSG